MQLAHNSKDLCTPKFVADEFWEQFQFDILAHINELQDLEQSARKAMPDLHRYLCSQSEYQIKMARIQHEPIEDYSLSLPIFENDTIRVNLNAIEPQRGLPLHDHPDSAGLTFIIQGQANIVQCNTATSAKHSNVSNSILTVAENKIFSSGEISCFTKDQHNIHSINAVSERCVMLVVHTNVRMTKKQSYFFTENTNKTTGLQLLTQRVGSETLKKFRINKIQKNS